MTTERINSLFTLFAGETDTEKYEPLIASAMTEVRGNLKADADENDVRLDYLCGAIAAFRYTQITAVKNKVAYTYGGTADKDGNIQLEYDFARALLEEYRKCASDLLVDSTFEFCGVKG